MPLGPRASAFWDVCIFLFLQTVRRMADITVAGLWGGQPLDAPYCLVDNGIPYPAWRTTRPHSTGMRGMKVEGEIPTVRLRELGTKTVKLLTPFRLAETHVE